MPLFRFHRGGLDESLKTTILVKTFDDLKKALLADFEGQPFYPTWDVKITVNPYPSEDNNFDHRIGWFTQMVKGNVYDEDKMHPIGFLSEPF